MFSSYTGRTKTLKRLSDKYYWTNMVEDLVAMVSCAGPMSPFLQDILPLPLLSCSNVVTDHHVSSPQSLVPHSTLSSSLSMIFCHDHSSLNIYFHNSTYLISPSL